MNELVPIGKVLKPRGLKGELKCIISISQNALNNKILYVGNKELLVKKLTSLGDFCYITFDDITTIEQAEKLRGIPIMFPRNQIELAEDEVLTSDLIGYDIFSESKQNLGSITAIQDYGSSVIINAKNSQGIDFSFPYEDDFIAETNMKAKEIIIKAQMLEVEIAD